MEDKINVLEDEENIVQRAKSNDEAFEALYYHYFPKIYAYVSRRVSSREAAEDIVSEVFLKAFSNIKKYEARGFSFGAWLYRIATNTLTDYYRKRGRAGESVSESLDDKADSKSLEKEAENSSDRIAIEKVLSLLPERYRQVVHLRYFAQMDIDEIAQVMKVSKSHASVIIHRALESFKREASKSGIKFFCFIF